MKNKINENMLEYLSEVIDSESGEISKPFKIDGKKYQMVRAITPNKEKIMGVYSFNEVDENGNAVIYDVNEFEKKLLNNKSNKTKHEKMENENKTSNSFEGYKHFIVNPKLGKARKFKTIEELAKAKMDEGEKYMGIKEFKKFVDEALFGARKTIKENPEEMDGQSDEEMHAKAKKLMDLISKRIPSNIIGTIKTNKVAQREVIAAFAELIGVPRNGLSQLIAGIKDIAKSQTGTQQSSQTDTSGQMNEGKKVIKKIKIKDIK